MAERKISMPIALKKNNNQYNAGYGMYFYIFGQIE